MSSIEHLLPPELLLGPHLSAYRYFFICTLTIAAWDTLVLTARTWRMMKTPEWPLLKIIMFTLRYLMPIEFIILAVSCFSPSFTPEICSKYYLFEPIMTACLLSISSLGLVVRVRAIYDSNRAITFGLGSLLAAQVVVHFACCFFYHPLALVNQQGCISAPKHNWVGIYWVIPTLLYLVTFALAIQRSVASLQDKPLSWWKLINRDGLNLYATIFGVNLVNVIYFFSTKQHDDKDPLKIIVTVLATVLTCTMTMRVILLVRGSLSYGGSFSGSSFGASGNTTDRSYPVGGTKAGGAAAARRGGPQRSSISYGSGAAAGALSAPSVPTTVDVDGHSPQYALDNDDEEGKGPTLVLDDQDVDSAVWGREKTEHEDTYEDPNVIVTPISAVPPAALRSISPSESLRNARSIVLDAPESRRKEAWE